MKEGKGHNQKVNDLKQILLGLDLPILPLNTVKCGFYVPDVITRVDTKFIVMDFINSKERVSFDVGGLALSVTMQSTNASERFTGSSRGLTAVGWDIIIGPDGGEGWALPYQELKWEIPDKIGWTKTGSLQSSRLHKTM